VRLAAGSKWGPERATVQAWPDRPGPSRFVLGEVTVHHGEATTSIELPRSLLGCRLGTTSVFDRAAVHYQDVDLEALPTDFGGSLQMTVDALLLQGHTDIGSLDRVVGRMCPPRSDSSRSQVRASASPWAARGSLWLGGGSPSPPSW
jgi:hypothetical protein